MLSRRESVGENFNVSFLGIWLNFWYFSYFAGLLRRVVITLRTGGHTQGYSADTYLGPEGYLH